MSNNQFQGQQKGFNKNNQNQKKGNMNQKQQPSDQDRKYPGGAPFDHNSDKNR